MTVERLHHDNAALVVVLVRAAGMSLAPSASDDPPWAESNG